MKALKIIITPILIALAVSSFTACSGSSSNDIVTNDTDTNRYIINETENRDIPLDAQVVSASATEAQVKITRDVEADSMNVYVISGSVEVTEVVE